MSRMNATHLKANSETSIKRKRYGKLARHVLGSCIFLEALTPACRSGNHLLLFWKKANRVGLCTAHEDFAGWGLALGEEEGASASDCLVF